MSRPTRVPRAYRHTAYSALTAAAVGLLLGACASAPAPSGGARVSYDDCFFASTLRDWRPLDNRNLILFADGRRPYHVELVRPAPSLGFNIRLGVYDRDGRICPYGGDAVVVDGFLTERIPIRSIRRLTEEQLEEVYVRFGIRPPVVIDAEQVQTDEETGEAGDESRGDSEAP